MSVLPHENRATVPPRGLSETLQNLDQKSQETNINILIGFPVTDL